MKRLLSKLHKLTPIKISALNGFIFGLLLQIFLCAVNLYIDYLEYLDSIKSTNSFSEVNNHSIRAINWHWEIAIFSIVTLICGILIGYLIQKSVFKNIKSEILHWQIFGVIFFLAFWIYGGISGFIKDAFECENFYCKGSTFLNYLIPDEYDLPVFVILFLLVAIFNLLFSLFLITTKTYYSELK